MLTITHVEKFFYAFVELLILLITKFKISYFIKHVIFLTSQFLYSTKFFKHMNNCFKFNFSKFLFKLYYQKLLKKSIKMNWIKLNKNTNFFLNENFSSKNSIFIFDISNFCQLFDLRVKTRLLLIFNKIIVFKLTIAI